MVVASFRASLSFLLSTLGNDGAYHPFHAHSDPNTPPPHAQTKGFPKPGSLHPFEAALLDLTVGTDAYTAVTARAAALRNGVQEVGKAYAARAARAGGKREAAAVAEEGAATLEKVRFGGWGVGVEGVGSGGRL